MKLLMATLGPWRWQLFCAALALPQLAAQVQQWRGGFRPGGAAPGRVLGSWDMFAPRIERCGVRWTPPLAQGTGASLASLRDLSPRLEWDVVTDRVADYRSLALAGCSIARQPTRVNMLCFLPTGEAYRDDFDCP